MVLCVPSRLSLDGCLHLYLELTLYNQITSDNFKTGLCVLISKALYNTI